MQEVKQVKRMRTPRYPSREAALAQPELLKLLPERWRQCRQAAAAAGLLASMAITSTGCSLIAPTPMNAGAPTMTPVITEADALENIRAAVGTRFSDLAATYKTSSAGKPVEYVSFDMEHSGYQIVKMDKKDIDLFSTASNVGFEYLDAADESSLSSIEYTDQLVGQADQKTAYVLVVGPEHDYDVSSCQADITKQVQDFLSWLKAEGIG